MGALSSLTPSPAWFRLDDDSAVGAARRLAVDMAQALQIGQRKIDNLAIIVSELGTNLVKHAEEGVLLVRPARHLDHVGVELLGIDSGPGIADLSAVHQDGHSTTGTLGIGLGAVGRLADCYDVYSRPGHGTVVVAQLWHGAVPPRSWADGMARPLTGESVSGDCFATREDDGRHLAMLCDGLGHGPLAAAAAQAAFGIFHSAPAEHPAALVERLHRGLSHTRGAAVLVVEVDPQAGSARACGLGNVSGVVLTDGDRRGLVSMPGIAGHGRAVFREFSYPWQEDSLLVMHSDGVTDRWRLDAYPGLQTHSPVLVAATVLRDAGVRRDDACVLAARTGP